MMDQPSNGSLHLRAHPLNRRKTQDDDDGVSTFPPKHFYSGATDGGYEPITLEGEISKLSPVEIDRAATNSELATRPFSQPFKNTRKGRNLAK